MGFLPPPSLLLRAGSSRAAGMSKARTEPGESGASLPPSFRTHGGKGQQQTLTPPPPPFHAHDTTKNHDLPPPLLSHDPMSKKEKHLSFFSPPFSLPPPALRITARVKGENSVFPFFPSTPIEVSRRRRSTRLDVSTR